MAEGNGADEEDLPAGPFAAWLREMQGALRGERASDVPCGGCTACCTSSQFVHIGPDETETLARIPRRLQFPAPRMPAGHVIVGYDERGHCPMLAPDGCSIYEHRPRTCRTYDCRVFPAAGIRPDDETGLIAQRARRWQFDYPTDADRAEHDAVRAAARSIAEQESRGDPGSPPPSRVRIAVRAVEVHDPNASRHGPRR